MDAIATNTTTQLNPYLNFNGKTEAAINFYHSILGGEIKQKMTFGESPGGNVPESQKDKIMHIHYEFDGCTILASDGMGKEEINMGNNIHLSVYLTDKDRAISVFNQMSEGGTVTMPFNEVFWGGHFGMLIDKFGVQWMVSCP